MAARAQSFSPAGEKLTSPVMYPRRATRDGGSALTKPLTARAAMPIAMAKFLSRTECICMTIP
jgi:hypothetical protein